MESEGINSAVDLQSVLKEMLKKVLKHYLRVSWMMRWVIQNTIVKQRKRITEMVKVLSL